MPDDPVIANRLSENTAGEQVWCGLRVYLHRDAQLHRAANGGSLVVAVPHEALQAHRLDVGLPRAVRVDRVSGVDAAPNERGREVFDGDVRRAMAGLAPAQRRRHRERNFNESLAMRSGGKAGAGRGGSERRPRTGAAGSPGRGRPGAAAPPPRGTAPAPPAPLRG